VLPEGYEELDDFIQGSMKGDLRNELEWQLQKLIPPSYKDDRVPNHVGIALYVSACLLTQFFFLTCLIFKVELRNIPTMITRNIDLVSDSVAGSVLASQASTVSVATDTPA